MFTEWATRRLFKFLLKKRIGRYIRGDLDLEQLDVQLGSGIAQLNDVVLNVDYINEQISETPLELKEGSLGSVTLKLQWKALPTISIELDGLELVFIPRKSSAKNEAAKINPVGFDESVHESNPFEGEEGGSGPSGAHAYLPVQEGVRVVANLVEKLLLGMHVSVRHAIVAFEGGRSPTQTSHVSRSMLICRLGCAEYSISYLSDQEIGNNEKEPAVGSESVLLSNAIRFDQLTLELLDALHHDYENSDSKSGNGVIFGQPVPLLQNDQNLFGCVKLSVPWKNDCVDIMKLDADVSVSDINLQFTYQQIPQLVSVVSAYGEFRRNDETVCSHVYDSNECSQSNDNPNNFKEHDEITTRMEAVISHPAVTQSSISQLSVLPGAKLISDWVHWNSEDTSRYKEVMSEADFASSTEEFFDCFDDTRSSQAILTGSGLWTWTCSAFNAITAASTLASGSILMLHESTRQIQYDAKINIRGISIILKEGNAREQIAMLNPRTTSKISLVSWLSESVILHTDYSKEDHIETNFSDIHCDIQVSPRNLRCEVIAKQIEVFEIKYQHENFNLYDTPMLQCISTSSQTLQDLIEKSLPPYPVSLCDSTKLTKAFGQTKKCLLRFSNQLPAGKGLIEHDFPSLTGCQKENNVQNTIVSLHFQPVIVWFDATLVRKLHVLSDIIGGCNKDPTAAVIAVKSEVRTSNSIKQVYIYMPSLRLLTTAPSTPGSELLKSHILCLDLSTMENVNKPFFKLKLSDSAFLKQDSPCFCFADVIFKNSTLHLVSPSESSEGFGKRADLCFMAQSILNISSDNSKMASTKILFREKAAGGPSLAQQTWIGVTHKQKGGMGSRKMKSEFAAATATEEVDKENEKIREDLRNFSSTDVHVVIPHVKVELNDLQLCAMVEIFSAVTEVITSHVPDVYTSSQQNHDQTSLAIDVQKIEITAHCNLIRGDKNPILSDRKISPWASYTIDVTKFQLVHVTHLGMIKNVGYFWLHHETGSIAGLLQDESPRELQLLTCKNDALGRGDGSGGNALATSSAGLELLMMVWPGGTHDEDMLINVTIRGCTFMAHGGRLDWFSGLTAFACLQVDKKQSCQAIEEKWYLPVPETVLLNAQVGSCMMGDAASSGHNCILFSLDLHDAALCYEPGKEAISAASLRARAEDLPNNMDQFSPVACTIAAAAVRVSSNAVSNNASKDYEIWLRDVAILLADTTLRRNRVLDYTPESLHQAGYVKVAGEAVVEAIVHLNSEGLQWEVECANNQLRLDTCHDTTAALGRLIAQLQQLLAPEVDNLPSGKRWQHEAGAEHVENLVGSQQSSCELHLGVSYSNLINTEMSVSFVENSAEALAFVKGSPIHSDISLEETKGELTKKTYFINDDGTDESICNPSDNLFQDGEETKDYWIPISQNDDVPSFIEDYYVPKNSSLRSSESSSSNQSIDEFDSMVAVEGSGGWYDGHSFNVLENHVPIENEKNLSKRQRGTVSHMSKRSVGISSKYPPSVGRIVFRDLNLKWRLYGGSDWVGLSQNYGSRQAEVCLEVICNGVNLEYDTFSETGEFASRMDLSIRDVWIYDCSQEAPWKKILGYKRSKSCPRESSAKALNLELESVRPDPAVPIEEYRLSLKLLPLLLHIDQRHLDFVTNFFSSSSLNSSQQLHSGYEEIFTPHFSGLEGSTFSGKMSDSIEELPLPFFQICELQPFSIRVDYVPRRVDIGALRAGNYAELFNLVSWKGIELNLKHVRALGIHGWGALSGVILGEWLEDISSNQIHKVLKGVGPIRPLFAVGSGAAKLIVVPAEHYKRDRRSLLRGMRKGAIAFLHSISLETVGLGVQLAAGAHEILLQTESALGSVGLSSSLEKVDMPVKLGQPGDLREGLQQACESLTRGLERTASSLIGNPVKAYQRGAGTSSAVATALRAAPAAAVAPATAAAGAVHRALLGVRNSLDPEHRRESEEKHSGPPLEPDSEMFL